MADSNVELLKQAISGMHKKIDKEKVDNSINVKPAKVIGVDEETYKVFVYFLDDVNQREYTFYNKSGEVINEGDNVKVYYTTNPAKGWIGARCGIPVIKEINGADSSLTVLTSYEYLTDTSVKFNDITYTIEKDSSTGLISKITDSYNHEFTPTINSGITDTALHNAVFWAVAMLSGLGEIPDKVLFSGLSGVLVYPAELTGFQAIRRSAQVHSNVYSKSYADGSVGLRIEKSYGITRREDSYTDAIVVRSNERINLTEYKTLRVKGIVYQNHSLGLLAGAYFTVGEPGEAQQNTAYDFSGWKLIESTQYYSEDYTNPGKFVDYDIDISGITGMQYLNFGVYHGTEYDACSCYLEIKKITLIA